MKTVAVLLSLVAVAQAQDSTQTQAAPAFEHPWAKFKKDSFVKTTITMNFMGQNIETTQKQTLKDLTKDDFTVEVEMDIPGVGPQKQEKKMSLKGLPGSSEDKAKKVGDEEIECDGQKFKCEIWEYTTEDTTTKAWICKDAKVCANAIKTEQNTKQEGNETKITSKVVKLSDKVKIGEKEIDCSIVEISMENAMVNLKGKAWQSPDVPGFTVKNEMKGTAQGMEGDIKTLVTEYEKK